MGNVMTHWLLTDKLCFERIANEETVWLEFGNKVKMENIRMFCYINDMLHANEERKLTETEG